MTSTEVAALNETEQALVAAQDEEFDSDFIQAPILKVGQALTREVQNDQAEAGEFINTLTGESLGTKVGFIVAYYNRGRFASDEDNRAYVAFSDEIPAAWEDLVGKEFVGTPFSEYPDAEETFKARVNRKEIPWGKGPLVSTTHNFTGLVLSDDGEAQPARLSLKRTDVPAAKKIITLKRALLRGRPFWDIVFDLTTEKKTNKGAYFNINVRTGRKTEADEKAVAQELALAVQGQRIVSNDDGAADKPVDPGTNGGLDLG